MKLPKTNPKTGLTQSEAQDLLAKFGHNEIKTAKQKNYLIEFLKEFTDLLSLLLVAATVFSFIAGEAVDATIIAIIILINGTISFVQKFKADKAVEALQKLVAPHAYVLRDGQILEIGASMLVPGDIVYLKEGNRIPADCHLIEANELYVGESILTGESVPVLKNSKNTVFMGTEVVSGEGIGLITHTGLDTKFGQIATLTTSTKKELSPLEKELKHIGKFVLCLAILIGLGVIAASWIYPSTIIEKLLFAASVAVAAVPEGLPATVTIALALGVQRLAKHGVIIKQLSSVETLGSTNVIVTDKTGTLTKNEMTVKEFINLETTLEFTGTGYSPTGGYVTTGPELGKQYLEDLVAIATLCNSSALIKDDEGQYKIIGDPTEGSLLPMIYKLGYTESEVTTEHEIINKIPFNSVSKFMEVETRSGLKFLKGAPDIILEKCTHYQDESGNHPLSSAAQKQYNLKLENLAEKSRRTLGLAITKGSQTIFLGLVGIYDPPRAEIADAIEKAKTAGIKIIMATGDYGKTALAIAKELGIGTEKNITVITGSEFEKLTSRELNKILKSKQNLIFARVKPEHKLRIVELLQKNKQAVAVTGDGVNDAPALKKADIGIAMGISGTEVSQEASDMVLSNDNFAGIIEAIQEGRTTYANLQKFIHYIFSCNIGELIVIFTVLAMGYPSPTSAILLLTINIGTDLFPALALSIEPSETHTMYCPPRKTTDKILSHKFIIRSVSSGIIIGVIATLTYFEFYQSGNYAKTTTAVFASLVTMQLLNTFNSKSSTKSIFSKSLWNNLNIFAALAASLALMILVTQTEFLNKFMKTSPLSLQDWTFIIGTSLIIILFEETRKIYVRRQQA